VFRKLASVLVLLLFVATITGCFWNGDDETTVAMSSSSGQSLEIEGSLPNMGAPGLNLAADRATAFGTSGAYSISVIDKDTNAEIGTVSVSLNTYKATVGISNTSLCPVIIVKESKAGRMIFANIVGKIPASNELPSTVKTLKVSGISVDATTTARALIAMEKKTPITNMLFTVSTAEVQAGTVTKSFTGQKTAIDSHLETKVIGLANVNEFAKAVTAMAAILTSSNVSDSVKNTIAPSITNATQLLTAFVKLAKSTDNTLKAVLTANQMAGEINLSKTRICSDTDDQTIATIIAKLNADEKVDNPAFVLAAGTYTAAQSVAITCPTSGAAIYYTLDGTTPTTTSTLYTTAITVSATATIKAIAIKSGMIDSDVVSATYTINIPIYQVAVPIFSVSAGTYTSTQSVEITSLVGATIYYTLDGSTPTAASTKYTGSISVPASVTIKAMATKSGMTDSGVITAAYTINIPLQQVSAPAFSVAAGTYTSTQSVEITSATAGTTIYYTLDGSTPVTTSTLYAGSISVSASTTIKAIAVKSGMANSNVSTAAYVINIPLQKIATPTFTVATGTYTSTQSVEIKCTTTGAKIYYTVNGTAPTSASTLYSGTISVSITSTVKAVAIKTGMADSDAASAIYTINLPFSVLLTAFSNDSAIPDKYAKSSPGSNYSVPLTWANPPAGTKSFTVTCTDDMGTPADLTDDYMHWIIYNIPATATGLAENIAKTGSVTTGILPSGTATQGTNQFGNIGYDGPEPPAGTTHKYNYTVYALNVDPTIASGINKVTFLFSIYPNIIQTVYTSGTYKSAAAAVVPPSTPEPVVPPVVPIGLAPAKN
jgi:Raf kinase inhibitor-like YbhB/YbcL family protein